MPVSSDHDRTPFRLVGRFMAVAVWAALIYAASDRPDLRVSDDDLLDFVLRKIAHVVVFGVLAVLVWRAARGVEMPWRAALATAWIATLAYAVSDEWHQTFVNGRVGHPIDVAIDMIGATAAVVVLGRPRFRSESPEVQP